MTHWIRRAAGLALLLLTILPLYRQLPQRETGLTGRSTAENVELQMELLRSGFLILLIIALLAGMLLDRSVLQRAEDGIGRALRRLSVPAFATSVGLLAAALTTVVAITVFERRPNLADAILQLTHARYFAAGQLGGPADFAAGFWHMQNSVVTDAGWFSQYPPGHIALLALGYALGAEWLVGPVVMGLTASIGVLVMHRLMAGNETAARLAGLAAGLSPMLLAHAASFMNHATAALFGVLAIYCALRALDGPRWWAAGAGAAVTAQAAVRPLAAVVTMLVVAGAIWLHDARAGRGAAAERGSPVRRFLERCALAVLGGLPFLAAHLWYNGTAFGGPTTFGYDATWGPTHGLGFHLDPWGHTYGPIEALLYTSADLVALNLNLLETLLPHVTLVGVWLLVARTLRPGERVLALWALLPVLANALYWHHGFFMGPRMLAEFAPAWAGVSVVAIHGLLERLPSGVRPGLRLSPRSAATALLIAGAAAGVVLVPQRLASYGGDWLPAFRAAPPAAPDNSVVFVHGAWEQRLMTRLASRGLRLDVVETAMRQNPTCLVQRHFDALGDGGGFGSARATPTTTTTALPPLDLAPRTFEYLPRPEIAPDVRIRLDTARALDDSCRRQIQPDRYGATDASFFLWMGDLPGIESGRPMYARDLGPELNRHLLERYPNRTAWMYGHFGEGESPRLLPYDRAVRMLWGDR